MIPEKIKKCRRCRETVRHPVINELDRFCCRGCFRIFYAKRCIVCEEPKTSSGLACTRPACQLEWDGRRRHETRGRYVERAKIPDSTIPRSETPIFIGSAPGFRLVAGPSLAPLELKALQSYSPEPSNFTPEQRRAAREMRLREFTERQHY